jgi:hypothetical protein
MVMFPVEPTPASDFQAVFEAIAIACPSLKELKLHSFCQMMQNAEVTVANLPVKEISMDHLRPLLACTQLQILSIADALPVVLKPDDIDAVSKAWPNITMLDLSANVVPKSGGTSLPTLHRILRECLRLKDLSIFLDTSSPDFFVPSDRRQIPTHLRRFNVGSSVIEPGSGAPVSLAMTLPVKCHMSSGNTNPENAKAWSALFEHTIPLLRRLVRTGALFPVDGQARLEATQESEDVVRYSLPVDDEADFPPEIKPFGLDL